MMGNLFWQLATEIGFTLRDFLTPFPISIYQYKMQCFIYDSFLSIAIFLSTQVRYDGKRWLSYLRMIFRFVLVKHT